MIAFPYRVVQSVAPLRRDGGDLALFDDESYHVCQDCTVQHNLDLPTHDGSAKHGRSHAMEHDAIYRCELLTRAIYLCEDHYLARKAADDKTADLHQALSRGFDSGNYANAYTSEDFDQAWEAEDDEDRNESDERVFKHPAFKSAFLIGFFGSYEEDEIPRTYVDDWRDAMHAYAPTMQAIGIAVSRDDDEKEDTMKQT